GRYPLHCACIEGQAGFAIELLDKGVNVNSANENGYTALHYSAMWSQLDCLKVLLNKGADVNLKTLNEETAYDVAKRYKK
ncbi:hypothetical protein HELRODRAFT_135312, partial [Helobdella robusta]|uniref:Uncharacterized protein n=1 Tax=Helobdella robusta TaxID=6412 RepID=T1EI80_HELRO